MSDYSNTGSNFPGEALALAEALSIRHVEETNTIGRLFAELQGIPYVEPTLEEQVNARMGSTVLLLAR